MKALRRYPHLLEVNARLWLSRLAARSGQPCALSTLDQTELERIAERFDMLWLMGVWRRSPAARQCALGSSENLAGYEAALPGFTAADVEGSPYAVHGYELDPALGQAGDLQRFRARLHEAGLHLIVDFVTNHLALDHPLTLSRPELFVRGTEQMAQSRAGQFFRTVNGDWLAHGRDPYFSPWSDTAQLDLFCPETRAMMLEQLLAIARVADGVRCDMAMLGLSEVFERVWSFALPTRKGPAEELWRELISAVKTQYPEFVFVAEAYWGLETRLLELGFDYAYDKNFYDLLLGGSALELRQHLTRSGTLLERAVRFTENHDEKRAVAAFGRERSQAAAIATLTLPGLRLVHDGQLEGRRIKLPIQLVREPPEPLDEAMAQFYERLLALAHTPAFHEGTFQLLKVSPPSAFDESHRQIVAFGFSHGSTQKLVLLNQSSDHACGRVYPPPGVAWPVPAFAELLRAPPAPIRQGDQAAFNVELEPWSAQLLGTSASLQKGG